MKNVTTADSERRLRGARYTYDTIRGFFEFSNDFLCVCTDGAIDFINGAGLQILGVNEEQQVIGNKISEFLAPEFVDISDNSRDLLILILDEEEALRTKIIGLGGRETAVEISVYWAREFGENSVIVRATDISKQVNLTQEVHRGQERFSRLVDNAMDMICSCKDGTVSFINKSGIKLMKAETRDQIVGASVASLFHEDYQEIFGEFIQDLIQDDDRFPAKLARLDGTHIDVHIAITQMDTSNYQNYMLEVRDISEHRRAVMALHDINLDLEKRVKERTHELSQEIKVRKKAENKLRRLATHDSLTGLPNRSLLMDRIENAVAVAQRNNGNAALMFIDLDGFKAVNDTLGHDVGDALLKDVAKRLLSRVRKMDTVARLGGDEFVVLLATIPSEKMAASVAAEVLEALSNPFDFNNKAANIGGSIGISFYPQHGEDAEALLKQADGAMYNVKKRGKNNIAIAPLHT